MTDSANPNQPERRQANEALMHLIERLERDIERLTKATGELSTVCGKLASRVEILNQRVDQLESRERPCSWFQEHKNWHDRRDEKSGTIAIRVVSTVIAYILTGAIGAAAVYYWGQR